MPHEHNVRYEACNEKYLSPHLRRSCRRGEYKCIVCMYES